MRRATADIRSGSGCQPAQVRLSHLVRKVTSMIDTTRVADKSFVNGDAVRALGSTLGEVGRNRAHGEVAWDDPSLSTPARKAATGDIDDLG